MGQGDIIKLLEKIDRWWTIKEINELLGYTNASGNLLKLTKQGVVIRRRKASTKGHYYSLFRLKKNKNG